MHPPRFVLTRRCCSRCCGAHLNFNFLVLCALIPLTYIYIYIYIWLIRAILVMFMCTGRDSRPHRDINARGRAATSNPTTFTSPSHRGLGWEQRSTRERMAAVQCLCIVCDDCCSTGRPIPVCLAELACRRMGNRGPQTVSNSQLG